ncbi:hypothetical protein ACJIZ3_023194 [Penstemon smallii]|uniref:AB hydrolase-1 domain-containing protein n=1 Tax=Penstemon smallii TaxID=265156 RepID=A0ABD3TQS6_9LAMI
MVGGGSCLSAVSLCGSYLRRSINSAGIFSQKLEIDSGDTTIHFWGPPAPTSKPKLILLHGFGPQSIWQWHKQIPFFAPKFDVYVPDLLFFGDSYSNSHERSEIFQASSIAKFLEKLGIQKYSVMGTSYGGFVTYRLAAMWPDRVEKVVIASSGVNLRRRDNEGLIKRANVERIDDVMLPNSPARLRVNMGLGVYKPPYIPDFILKDFVDKLFLDNKKEKMELLKGLTLGRDNTIDISPLPQEVLIVWGDQDKIFLLEKATELKELLGEKARLEVIKNTAHTPQLEQPSKFNKILKNFLHDLS